MKTRINRRKRSTGATAAASAAQATGVARSRVSEARKAALVKAVKTVLACQEISNLMARFMTAMNYKQPEEVLACFALQQQDVSWEFADEGVFQGPDAVRQIIYETIGKPFQVGEMLEQHLNTPAIEVAGDLKTAKGFWRAPGFGAIPQVQMLPVAIWNWDVLAADFIHDGATWKLWHGHSFRFVKARYHEGWVDDLRLINRPNIPVHPLAKPATYHNPYTPLSIREAIPAVPIPYETWTGSDWMLERDKSK